MKRKVKQGGASEQQLTETKHIAAAKGESFFCGAAL